MARRPNVVLIVSDDHGYADRGALGIHPAVSTPGLDRLAAEGVSCREAYVTAPICSPSRAGIISGRHQARWGALWFDSSSFPPDDTPTMAERFGALGYTTGYLGKVHYGREVVGDRACPEQHGFDEAYYGLAGGQMGRLNYLHHSKASQEAYGEEAASRMAVAPMLDRGAESELEGFLTAELGDRAGVFVERHGAARRGGDDEPFFLMLCFNAVHNFAWQLPEEELAKRGLPARPDWRPEFSSYLDWYDDAISPHLEHGRGYYLAQLELMDAEIARLLDRLDALGIGDDTIVAYTTDNGGSTCNFGDNTPLRGTKYGLHEGGVRVPMLFRWPGGGLPGGTAVDGLVSSLDLSATLLAAAGADLATLEDLDGVDQLPLLRGDGGPGHDQLCWQLGWAWAIRTGPYKLSWHDPDSEVAEHLRDFEHAPIGRGFLLADLTADLGETHDLSADHPELLTDLAAQHAAWWDSVRHTVAAS